MPETPWLLTDQGNQICYRFSMLCSDIISAFLSADKSLDNYDRYNVFAAHAPGRLIIIFVSWNQCKEFNALFINHD